jgi:hypothetical protein
MDVTCGPCQKIRNKSLSDDVLNAPISRTATIVPTSIGLGELKYLRKWGPVIIPDMTLRVCEQRQI